MGYDMYWVERDPADEDAYRAASSVFNGAVNERNSFPRGSENYEIAQKTVDVAYEEMTQAERYYFRLNIWGMGRARDVMQAARMLCDPPGPSKEDWDSVPERDDEADDGGEPYRLAHDKIVSEHRGECPGIPLHKLCSNDGWIVTPSEIHAALQRKDMDAVALAKIDVPDWWQDWISWLIDAADHGGFRVY